MIRVEGLTKRYPRTVAVDDISFTVGKGEIIGFLGPNGAGKTTTMRVLTCFLPPSAGMAEVAGFDVVKQPMEVKKRIGYLPETPPLYPEMEVREYLQFVGRLKQMSGASLAARIEEVGKRCHIDDVMPKLISKLSKGYRQRVGLAQAIIHNPEVLILDEPTSGLDPKQILETRSLIKELAGEHTIILSTHILPEVEQVCEKVIIINKGRVVATDSVSNLTSRLRGSDAVGVEVGGASQADVESALGAVAGVATVKSMGNKDGVVRFEVESRPGESIRPEIARSVVQAGWQLHELHSLSFSLEEIFLQLTSSDAAVAAPKGDAQ
ncbi:MAG TPA: ATP-binding cassette domain-containing protein [Bryobacteraceae bacterium]|jgi:gliding motility-associated transport system ATP-binding protein|nr:ATP-binding cassette domain-containing protein [Bryobacteraceae bacterium]